MEPWQPSWAQASWFTLKTPLSLLPASQFADSSSNHTALDQTFFAAYSIKQQQPQTLSIHLNALVPSILYLLRVIGYLEDEIQHWWTALLSRGRQGYPAHYTGASLNGVSVPGCVGEWWPWACPQQCKGWSLGVRYKALGALGSLQSCKVWHGALPW